LGRGRRGWRGEVEDDISKRHLCFGDASVFIGWGAFCVFGGLESSDSIVVGGVVSGGQGDGVDTVELGAEWGEVSRGVVETDAAEVRDAVALEMTDLMTDSADGVLLLFGAVAMEVAQWGEDRGVGYSLWGYKVFFVTRGELVRRGGFTLHGVNRGSASSGGKDYLSGLAFAFASALLVRR